jgi:leucyl aminopeptidase
MGLLNAVGRSSEHEPHFIRLDYTPRGPATGHIVFVGKGVTFDTGGIDLKRYPGLPTMKGDMGGAAAVLSLFKALPAIQPAVKITGLVPAAENAFSGNSYKPGDVYKSMSGKFVEIGDTDAEGRLILADALHYAKELKPDAIVDLATLTGSCVVALGELFAGLFSNSEKLAAEVNEAADRAFERFWRLPLPAVYRRQIHSPVADLKNISSSRYGDAIIAALFLKEFVGTTPWAHLDIAGPSWVDTDTPGYVAMGTGYAVRTLCQLVDPSGWNRERLR